MTTIDLRPDDLNARVRCDNCDWQGPARRCTASPGLEERLTAGSEVPAGDCPECQCFCYLERPRPAAEVAIAFNETRVRKLFERIREQLQSKAGEVASRQFTKGLFLGARETLQYILCLHGCTGLDTHETAALGEFLAALSEQPAQPVNIDSKAPAVAPDSDSGSSSTRTAASAEQHGEGQKSKIGQKPPPASGKKKSKREQREAKLRDAGE